MKHRIRCLLMALLMGCLLICPAFADSDFPDVDESSEYAEAIAYVSDAGIMVGDNTGNFNPGKTVTRAEMAVIICRMLDETENLQNSSDFTDVPASHWANPYISKAVELGIVNGYGNGKFGPSDDVTYAQAVTMIIRVLGGEDFAQAAGEYPTGYLTVAGEHGFLKGIRKEIGEPLSRGDIALLLMNSNGVYFVADWDSGQYE